MQISTNISGFKWLVFSICILLLTSCIISDKNADPGTSENKEENTKWECTIEEGKSPDYASALGCEADFSALASQPLQDLNVGWRAYGDEFSFIHYFILNLT